MDFTPLHETKIHGIVALHYSVYHGRIPEWLSSFPLHWHDDFELIFCVQGQMQATLWGRVYTLRAGDLVLVLPHGVHSMGQSGSEKGEYYNIMFHPSLFKGTGEDPCYEKYVLPFLIGERTMEGFYPAGSDFNREVSPCVQSLLACRRESYSTHELMIKSGLYLILHHMNQYSTTANAEDRCQQLSYNRLKNALFHVRKSYDHEITVKEAAGQCGFSESHFMKLFKEFTGMSFNAYLVDYRLELAAKQLVETDLKVIDIMENCGFHNQSYFTRAFRKKYGRTPVAYRAAGQSAGACPEEGKA